MFVQIIIEALIDNLVTPENLILLVNDPDKYKNLIEDKIESPIKKINYLKNANNNQLPYIFILDDLHWIDNMSLEALEYILNTFNLQFFHYAKLQKCIVCRSLNYSKNQRQTK